MADIAYKTWSLIYRDLEPSQQEPTVRNPPMMPNIAVDAGGSLVFSLVGEHAALRAHVTVTALSAEGRRDGFLQVLSGAAGALQPVPASWSSRPDGANVVLTASLPAAGPSLKLHLPSGPTLVVSAVAFER